MTPGIPFGCGSKLNRRGYAGFGFWSMFPLARVPFWYRFFEPQPFMVPFSLYGEDEINGSRGTPHP